MKFVVTGGAGFIGSNLVNSLIKLGEVTVLDNLSTGKIENIESLIRNKKIVLINKNITKLANIDDIFKDIDYVFHLAAIPNVSRSVNDPIESHEANATGTLNVLIASRDNNVKKVVYASSSSVYGDTPTLPKKEDMKPMPLSPYAVSKLMGEYYCKIFSELYGLKTISLRYFNVFGPNQDPSSEYSAVIPKFVSNILRGEKPVIFGDGKQTRDFTYVEDVVNANILSMEKESVEGIFNIAGGKRTSINELLIKISNILEVNARPIFSEPRSGDIRDSFADVSQAEKRLGYNPSYSLEKGLEETISWYKNYLIK